MLVETLLRDPHTAMRYVERYVNDGSPSGFSKNTTSHGTSPFGLTPQFHLIICTAPHSWFRSYGHIPQWPITSEPYNDAWILVHPDMQDNPQLKREEITKRLDTVHNVVPTASGRTVQFVDGGSTDYVKLHYDGILGRIHRALPYNKAASGPEVSRIITEAIDNGVVDARLAILPEPGSRALCIPNDTATLEWGMTWRLSKPYGQTTGNIHFYIPAFALFSADRLALHEPSLLAQLIDLSGLTPEEYVLTKIVIPILDCFFSMVLDMGFIPEWNAQNLLLGFDSSLNAIAFISRDLKSVEKDITLRETLGLPNKFEIHPFKCMERIQNNYQKKHSFMFDHKLGDCVIDPILSILHSEYNYNLDRLREAVRTTADAHIAKLPADFFPADGCWYMFKRVLVDQSQKRRPYRKLKNPKFRTVR